MKPVDYLIHAGAIIPIEPTGAVLTQHSIAIENDKIVGLMPTEQAREKFAAQRVLQLPNHVLMPGLINLHTHSAMALMRGFADDVPLMTWLNQHIWPTEAKFVSPEFVFDGTLLAISEMLRGGTTCFNDMYFFPSAAGRAAVSAKMRGVMGMTVFEFPSAYGTGPEDYFHKGLTARDEMSAEPLLTWSLAPHAPYTVSDSTFQRVDTLAEELDLPINLHVHETRDEIEGSLKEHGVRPLARLKKLGLLSPRLISVHSVHLTDEEISWLAETGSHIAHCPSSNLKLASGIARTHDLAKAGVNVGIGTDGAASNNKLDMLAELRLAALLAKGASGEATTWDAHTTLKAATLNAAKSLGLDKIIGSLVTGKQADIIAIDLSTIETQPDFHPASHTVYAAGREQVTHSWIAGELVMDNRRLTTIDETEILAKVKLWKAQLQTM